MPRSSSSCATSCGCTPASVNAIVAPRSTASFGLYTTTDEIDALVAGLAHVQEMFA